MRVLGSAFRTLVFGSVPLGAVSGELLQTPATLSLKTLLEFEREGHTVTRGLLSSAEFAEVATSLRKVAQQEEAVAREHSARVLAGNGLPDAPPPFMQTFNPHRRHAVARSLALSPLLAAAAAALLGVSRVRLYQDSMFCKRSGDDHTMWHADLWTAPIATNSLVTVWLPLHRVTREHAPLFFRSRSHHDLALMVHDEEYEKLGIDPDDVPEPGDFGVCHAPLEEGDATWHHGWTVHGAPPLSGAVESRFAYTATYFADGDRVLTEAPDGEDTPSYQDWHSQLTPGMPAIHDLLPLAYTAEDLA